MNFLSLSFFSLFLSLFLSNIFLCFLILDRIPNLASKELEPEILKRLESVISQERLELGLKNKQTSKQTNSNKTKQTRTNKQINK